MNPSATGTSSSEISDFFQGNGYYHAKSVYSPAEIKELEIDFDRIVQQISHSGEEINARWGGEAMKKIAAPDSVVVHTHNVQIYSVAWLRAMWQGRFLEVAQAILGPNVILHHSKLFQKPAEKGALFPTHQDWSYLAAKTNSKTETDIPTSDWCSPAGMRKRNEAWRISCNTEVRRLDFWAWNDVRRLSHRSNPGSCQHLSCPSMFRDLFA